jgi:transglutaminase-like putative cysteine protease
MIRTAPRSLVPVVLLSAIAAAQARKIFDVASWRWALIGIGLFCGVVAFVTARFPTWVRAAISAVTVLVSTAVIVKAADGLLPGDVLSSLTSGAGELLSGRWPSPVTPTTIGFVAAFAGTTSILGAHASLRRLIGPAQLLPSLAMLAAIALFASQAGTPSVRFLSAYVGLSVATLWLAAHDRQRANEEPEPVKQPRRAVVLATIGLLVLPIVFSGLLSSNRYDPRLNRDDPVQQEEDLSPLTVVDQLRTRSPEIVLFESEGTPVGRWRLVALNRYDGRAWMAPANLRRASTRLVDQVTKRNAPGVRSVNVTIKDLDGQWLPSPAGRTFEVSVPVRTDGTVSSLLAAKPLTPGTKYRIVANELGFEETAAASANADRTLLATLTDFQTPVAIRTLATQITAAATTDRDRAELLASYLRDNYQLDEQAPAGHSAGLLELFLTKTKRGRREQFVAAYALLSSAIGLPVRIVVGFAPAEGSSQVMSSTAVAWPEVAFEGAGWQGFDPTPATEGKQQRGTSPQAPNAQVQTPPPTTAAPIESTVPATPILPTTPRTSISKAKLLVIGVPLLLIIGSIAYVLGILDLKKRQWERRASADTTNGQVVGAFLNGTDRIIDLGVNLPPSGTDRELILVGASKLDAAVELAPLADMATEAAYGTRVMHESEVEDAQRYLRQFEIATASIPRKELLKARLSLRSLRKGLGPRRGIKHSGKP